MFSNFASSSSASGLLLIFFIKLFIGDVEGLYQHHDALITTLQLIHPFPMAVIVAHNFGAYLRPLVA